MLQLSGSLIGQPVLSLRTGGTIAIVSASIINPTNLKIEGFYCTDSINRKKQLILVSQDIRDIMVKGLVVNDHEVLAEPDELVRLQDTLALNFELIAKPVVTISKVKVGKVNDYAIETESMYIQKIYVAQPILKSLTGGSLSVDRTQIVEITNRKVVIQDLLQPKRVTKAAPANVPALPAM